jgi:ribose-phosphate pyrophosphokinase
MVVLKIERWLAQNLCRILKRPYPRLDNSLYAIDMSSKNSRWKQKIWLSEQLKTLHQP